MKVVPVGGEEAALEKLEINVSSQEAEGVRLAENIQSHLEDDMLHNPSDYEILDNELHTLETDIANLIGDLGDLEEEHGVEGGELPTQLEDKIGFVLG